MRLNLDQNEYAALVSALDSYLDGVGMAQHDEDEAVLESICDRLNAQA